MIFSRRIPGAPTFLAAFLLFALLHPTPVGALGGPRPIRVSVQGEVRRPENYLLAEGATLSTLLLTAGGATDNANLRGATLTRESAKTKQRIELREIVDELSRARPTIHGGWDAWRDFLEGLGKLAPLGRIPAPLSHPRLLKGSPADLPLEDGDTLRIPQRRDTVTVEGAVRAAGPVTLPHGKNRTAGEYVRLAGGYADDSDRGNTYLLRPDGTAATARTGPVEWNPQTSRWEIPALVGGDPIVGPGDTIFVPKKPAAGSRAAAVRNLPALRMRVAEITGFLVEPP